MAVQVIILPSSFPVTIKVSSLEISMLLTLLNEKSINDNKLLYLKYKLQWILLLTWVLYWSYELLF